MKKSTYSVRMECTIIKIVTCEDCTEDQAKNDPFAYSVDELEADLLDWQVLSVKEEK